MSELLYSAPSAELCSMSQGYTTPENQNASRMAPGFPICCDNKREKKCVYI